MRKTFTCLILILWLFSAAAQAGPPPLRFAGGSGDSQAQAVIIKGAPDGIVGARAEYQYLNQRFGPEDVAWRLVKEDLVQTDTRTYEVLTIVLTDRTQRTIYFDITSFFGKR
jgi:hypothetical protein